MNSLNRVTAQDQLPADLSAATHVTESKKTEDNSSGKLSPGGWLLFSAAVLLIVGLAVSGYLLNDNSLLLGAAGVFIATLSAVVTFYILAPPRSVTSTVETPVTVTPVLNSGPDQRTLLTGLEGMSEGLMLVQMDGRLLYANHRMEEFLQWCYPLQNGQPLGQDSFKTVDEWLNRVRPRVTHRESFSLCLVAARQYSGQGQVPSFEFGVEKPADPQKTNFVRPVMPAPFIGATGETGRDPAGDLAIRPVRDMRLTLFPVMDASGRQVGTGYLLRDVTRDRELDRIKDQFVSMVSHELRSPISVILALTELLQDSRIGEEERTLFVTNISEEAVRLRSLLADMLDISRLEEGKLELNLGPVELERLINKCIEQFRLQQQVAHEIKVEISTSDPRVIADPGKLEQVLTNLIGNALKYSPEGGQITIRIGEYQEPEESGLNSGKPLLVVSIADQGIGIPEKEQAQIFKRFYRSSASRRNSINGTGLGLSITQRLVKLMGGNIWFTSKEGEGSTFYFTLPAAN